MDLERFWKVVRRESDQSSIARMIKSLEEKVVILDDLILLEDPRGDSLAGIVEARWRICEALSKKMLGSNATEENLQDQARDLSLLPEVALSRTYRRIKGLK